MTSWASLETRSFSYRPEPPPDGNARHLFLWGRADGRTADMRRFAAVGLAAVVGVLGVQRLGARDDLNPIERPRPKPLSAPDARRLSALGPPSPSVGQVPNDAAMAAIATRWVSAQWTRPRGEGAFAWLDRVADITAPDLEATLRTARPWLDDEVISSSADITGVYPDSGDRTTLTVTCVAHRVMPAGTHDEPCVTTVTIVSAADGRLFVAAVR